mgnify:CR=1 FL=1
MTEPTEVIKDLRALAIRMHEVADAMWRLGLGTDVDEHARELHGAANIAAGWADGIERERATYPNRSAISSAAGL